MNATNHGTISEQKAARAGKLAERHGFPVIHVHGRPYLDPAIAFMGSAPLLEAFDKLTDAHDHVFAWEDSESRLMDAIHMAIALVQEIILYGTEIAYLSEADPMQPDAEEEQP